MIVRIEKFVGIAPRIAPQLLPPNAAITASNCKMVSGALLPFSGLDTVDGVTLDGGAVSLYQKKSTSAWTSFTSDTDVVRSPIPNDAWDRVYWTDANPSTIPKMGVYETFSTYYTLGVPAPTTSPTATQNGSDGTDPTLAETRAYLITYVSAYGEEGPPSDVTSSQFVTVYPGNTVDLTNIPTGPVGGQYNLVSKNIYRTNTGSTDTAYQLVATIALATASYNDAVDNDDLGVVLPSTYWDDPPTDLEGLCSHPAGFLVGFSGREVCLSEQFLPHAWPYANKYPVDSDIVNVAVFGNTIIVLTKRTPYFLTGNDPAAMYLEKPESGEACLSKRGVVDFGDVVVYPSARGLVAVGVGTPPTLITNDILSEDNWANYAPATLEGYRLGDKYFGVCGAGVSIDGFVFDLTTKNLVTLSSLDVKAGYYDETVGNLYLKGGTGDTTLYVWDADATAPLTYDWVSKVFVSPVPTSFGAGQVFADSYTDLTMKLYTDATLIHTQTVTSERPFRLPSGYLGTKWAIELTGTSTVNNVLIASTMSELQRI
jgi:hypothetical protein